MRWYRLGWTSVAATLAVLGILAGAFRHALIGAGIAGSSALVVALVLAVTSPWTVKALRRWSGAIRPSGDQLDAVMHALACSSPGFVPFQRVPTEPPATDEQLCRAWCASFDALGSTYAGAKFIRVVEERREYLDELERRNPAGFSAWLASGATACDNPLPYVSLAHVEPAAINWDELLEGHG